MVKICDKTYSQENEEKYSEYFNDFPYKLTDFQKFAIEGIVEKNHVLVTAHTGSGKSTCFQFAANFFTKQGKKVIYCSPIKALANQQYYSLRNKFPHMNIGIVTGDIKVNQDADVLIMITEVLNNTLFINKKKEKTKTLLSFDMDFDNDLACVIFDEFHYLNDPDRGHVWESCVMMLDSHIQILMLSATIDKPIKVAQWIENRKNHNQHQKEVYIASTERRAVPLEHYSFITTNQGIFKKIKKDEVLSKEVKDITDKLTIIQTSNGKFNEVNYNKTKNMLSLFEKQEVFVKPSHVLNNICKYLNENNLFPAICFVLSINKLETFAKEITVPILEDDSKIAYTIRREAEQIIRKLPNYDEYFHLPEYLQLISLLEKGIGIHHAKMISIFRELVELFLEKGYIKLLFATETFALGVNFPIKTVLFTSLKKFNGVENQIFYPHQYTQMAGRAGRVGSDKVGTVIHLTNLCKQIEISQYRNMMSGKPQTLTSKFKLSYNLILNLVLNEQSDILSFVENSMVQNDITCKLNSIKYEIEMAEEELQKTESYIKQTLVCPIHVCQTYINNIKELKSSTNKKRKDIEKQIKNTKEEYKTIERDILSVTNYNDKKDKLDKLNEEYLITKNYLNNTILVIIKHLIQHEFIVYNDNKLILSNKGFIASHIREVHPLVFAHMIHEKAFDNLSVDDIVSLFSCFTNVSIEDDMKSFNPCFTNKNLENIEKKVFDLYDIHMDFESINYLNTGTDYSHHYDLFDYMKEWYNNDDENSCKLTIQKITENKGIKIGEFVKAIIKINNISNELERIAETMCDIDLLSKLKQIPIKTMKFVVTSQSLYV
jgi:superfamily II RNA helicase